MFAIFVLFFVELIAFRWGSSKLAKIGIKHDPHGHGPGAHSHAAHGPESGNEVQGDDALDIEKHGKNPDADVSSSTALAKGSGPFSALDDSALAQITGIFILEFGILLHSVLIGLTLAVDEDFRVLFIVLVFHRAYHNSFPPFESSLY